MRRHVAPATRRCPFDINGLDRTGVTHDAYDFVPERWLLSPDTAGSVPPKSEDAFETDLRFVDEGISLGERRKAHLMSPFSTGPRSCTGRYLSLVEMTVFFSELMCNYKIEILALPTHMKRTFLLPEA